MRYLLPLLLIFSLSSCSIFGDKDGTEPMDLVDFDPSVQLDRVWHASIGDGQGDGFTRITPALDGDTLYAAGYKGNVYALNRLNGKTLWHVDLDEQLAGGVGFGGGKILLGTDGGELLVLKASDGSELWRTQLTGEIMSVPSANRSIVAVQTMDGKLTVLDANTGKEKWHYDNPPPKLTLRGRASPLITSTALYAGFANGRIMAFNPDNGLTLWERRVAMPKGRSDLDKMVDIEASPVLHNGILYISGYQGRLMAVSRSSGQPLWTVESSSYQQLGYDQSNLYVSAANSQVAAYTAAGGSVEWTNKQLLRRQITGPQVLEDYVAVADQEGYLHVLNKADGSFADRLRVDSSGVRVPLLGDGKFLYVLANDGTLAAYKIAK